MKVRGGPPVSFVEIRWRGGELLEGREGCQCPSLRSDEEEGRIGDSSTNLAKGGDG